MDKIKAHLAKHKKKQAKTHSAGGELSVLEDKDEEGKLTLHSKDTND